MDSSDNPGFDREQNPVTRGFEERSGEGVTEMERVAESRVTEQGLMDSALTGARDALQAAKDAIGFERVKPRLRGVTHQYALFAALVAGAVLVAFAPDGEARLVAAIYAFSLCAMFGVSALYHRIDWRPKSRRWMRRLDHSMIFVLVAGTYTPFAVLVLSSGMGKLVLITAWGGAVLGIILSLVWVDAPRWLNAAVYISLGWIAVVVVGQLLDRLGVMAVILILIGGLLYSAGAVIYAVKKPDPLPNVFGYHEIFHAFVILAAVSHFIAVAAYALPQG